MVTTGILDAVLFDMDGLMFDTETLNLSGWIEAGKKHGCNITEEDIRPQIGVAVPTARRLMTEQFGPDFDFDAVRNDRIAWSHAWIEKNGMPEKPGLRELLAWLEREGIRTAISTSSGHETVDFYLAHAPGLARYFDAVVTWEPGMQGKPAPDLFLAAARRLDARPEGCVVLEDSYNGIRAAHAAGMIPIMVPDRLPPTPEMLSLVYQKADGLDAVVPILERLRGQGRTR
ncbi:MAG: HAD family phosphatase [Fretibacterium sp.]|nr:HAD family phosphatase [Fretibacterium sp.]